MPNPTPAQLFSQQLQQLAAKFGIKLFVAAFPDPQQPAIPRVIATPGAVDVLKPALAEKLGLVDEAAVRERMAAEFEGSTGWDS